MKSFTKKIYKGFTLIELLVVIAIISLLSSIVYASLTSAREKAADSHKSSESREVMNAIELYRLDNNESVPSFSLVAARNTLHREGTPEYNEAMNRLVDGGYIPNIPQSPSGDDYAYIVSSDNSSAMFVSDQSGDTVDSDICRRVGNETFGQTGIDNSCEGSLGTGGGDDVVYCGQPPYSVKVGQSGPPEDDDYYLISINGIDPEGEPVLYSNLRTDPYSNVTCGITDFNGSFPISNLPCYPYGINSVDIVFDIYTEGCSLQEDRETLFFN